MAKHPATKGQANTSTADTAGESKDQSSATGSSTADQSTQGANNGQSADSADGVAAGSAHGAGGNIDAGDPAAAASSASTADLASAGSLSADQALGSDGLQAPATAVTGAASYSSLPPATVSDAVDLLQDLDDNELIKVISQHAILTEALAVVQASRAGAAAPTASDGSMERKQGVITFAGVVTVGQIGDLVEGTAAQLRGLVKSGDVDSAPESIAAAVARGAKVHQLGG